jgi:uncharacterized membrane protein (DUF4010 family)
VLFQIVLWVLSALRERLGAVGLLATSAVLGLTDVDALTFSLTELARRAGAVADEVGAVVGSISPEAAARGLVVGMLANTVFKSAVATALGANAFRLRVVAALAVLGGLLALGLLWI